MSSCDGVCVRQQVAHDGDKRARQLSLKDETLTHEVSHSQHLDQNHNFTRRFYESSGIQFIKRRSRKYRNTVWNALEQECEGKVGDVTRSTAAHAQWVCARFVSGRRIDHLASLRADVRKRSAHRHNIPTQNRFPGTKRTAHSCGTDAFLCSGIAAE